MTAERTYSVTLSRATHPGLTKHDAADIAAELARLDEFRVRDTLAVLPAGDGWQVILDVEPIRVEVTR